MFKGVIECLRAGGGGGGKSNVHLLFHIALFAIILCLLLIAINPLHNDWKIQIAKVIFILFNQFIEKRGPAIDEPYKWEYMAKCSWALDQ